MPAQSSRRKRKKKSLLPVYLALGIPLVVIVILLALALLKSFERAPTPEARVAAAPAPSQPEGPRMPDEVILRAIAQQQVRFLANYPLLVGFEPQDAFWSDPESAHVIYAGFYTDSIEEGEPGPQTTRFFALGMELDERLMQGRAAGTPLLDLAEVHRFYSGDRLLEAGPWIPGESEWEAAVTELETRLRAAR